MGEKIEITDSAVAGDVFTGIKAETVVINNQSQSMNLQDEGVFLNVSLIGMGGLMKDDYEKDILNPSMESFEEALSVRKNMIKSLDEKESFKGCSFELYIITTDMNGNEESQLYIATEVSEPAYRFYNYISVSYIDKNKSSKHFSSSADLEDAFLKSLIVNFINNHESCLKMLIWKENLLDKESGVGKYFHENDLENQ